MAKKKAKKRAKRQFEKDLDKQTRRQQEVLERLGTKRDSRKSLAEVERLVAYRASETSSDGAPVGGLGAPPPSRNDKDEPDVVSGDLDEGSLADLSRVDMFERTGGASDAGTAGNRIRDDWCSLNFDDGPPATHAFHSLVLSESDNVEGQLGGAKFKGKVFLRSFEHNYLLQLRTPDLRSHWARDR